MPLVQRRRVDQPVAGLSTASSPQSDPKQQMKNEGTSDHGHVLQLAHDFGGITLHIAKALFQRLQAQTTTPFVPGQLRTLQRRVREWRTAIASRLVFGASDKAEVLRTVCNSEPSA